MLIAGLKSDFHHAWEEMLVEQNNLVFPCLLWPSSYQKGRLEMTVLKISALFKELNRAGQGVL